MAVAKRASEIAGATVVRLVLPWLAMLEKAFMMPHTVPNRPMKGEAVAMTASRLSPSSMPSLSMAMTWLSSRSTCDTSRSPCAPLKVRPFESFHAEVTMTSSFWNGSFGCVPSPAAISSSARPELSADSKVLASLLMRPNISTFCTIRIHDTTDARIRIDITAWTTQSACMNRCTKPMAPL